MNRRTIAPSSSSSRPASWLSFNVGGGLRNTAALAQMLDAGVARAVVGSAAISQVEQVQEWLAHFGRSALRLAFDVSIDDDGSPKVMTHGWQRQSEYSLWNALDNYSHPRQHVLCTDVGRDGALTDPMSSCIARLSGAIRKSSAASGGIRNAHDLHVLSDAGAAAASAARLCWKPDPHRGIAAILAQALIPCLDVRDGQVVKGVKFAITALSAT